MVFILMNEFYLPIHMSGIVFPITDTTHRHNRQSLSNNHAFLDKSACQEVQN